MRGAPAVSPVAVIDIGSNSIKILIAARAASGVLASLHYRTVDARISAGITHTGPRLSEEGMLRGIAAIVSLLADTATHAPTHTVLVATSAVRDALNGAEFIARVFAATGHAIRLLSGDEEANLIGRGLTCDPAFTALSDFYVFDLGGGSLECLTFRDRRIEQAISLQLGCVRLTEKFVPDPGSSLTPSSAKTIADHTREIIRHADFKFSLNSPATAVGTGGTVTTVRTIIAARTHVRFEETSTAVSVDELRSLLAFLSAMPLEQRRRISGLPPARADVFPTALITLIELAACGGFTAFQNSLYNLRWGVVAETFATADKR